MAPKKAKLAPAKADKAAVDYVRIPANLWREVCIATARYYYVRTQHPEPARFDAAVDAGIEEEDRMAKLAAGVADPKPPIIQ